MSLLKNHFQEYASPARVQRVSVIYFGVGRHGILTLIILSASARCSSRRKILIIKDEGDNHLDILPTGYDMLCQALLGKIKSKK